MGAPLYVCYVKVTDDEQWSAWVSGYNILKNLHRTIKNIVITALNRSTETAAPSGRRGSTELQKIWIQKAETASERLEVGLVPYEDHSRFPGPPIWAVSLRAL